MMAGGGEITWVYVESDIIRRSSLQMINAIQEAIAPVGQTSVTTAPTVSALSRLHGSVGRTGEEPLKEFQHA
jgi:hypothetical protein